MLQSYNQGVQRCCREMTVCLMNDTERGIAAVPTKGSLSALSHCAVTNAQRRECRHSMTRFHPTPGQTPYTAIFRVLLRIIEYFLASHPISQNCSVFIRTPCKNGTGRFGVKTSRSWREVPQLMLDFAVDPNSVITSRDLLQRREYHQGREDGQKTSIDIFLLY